MFCLHSFGSFVRFVANVKMNILVWVYKHESVYFNISITIKPKPSDLRHDESSLKFPESVFPSSDLSIQVLFLEKNRLHQLLFHLNSLRSGALRRIPSLIPAGSLNLYSATLRKHSTRNATFFGLIFENLEGE